MYWLLYLILYWVLYFIDLDRLGTNGVDPEAANGTRIAGRIGTKTRKTNEIDPANVTGSYSFLEWIPPPPTFNNSCFFIIPAREEKTEKKTDTRTWTIEHCIIVRNTV